MRRENRFVLVFVIFLYLFVVFCGLRKRSVRARLVSNFKCHMKRINNQHRIITFLFAFALVVYKLGWVTVTLLASLRWRLPLCAEKIKLTRRLWFSLFYVQFSHSHMTWHLSWLFSYFPLTMVKIDIFLTQHENWAAWSRRHSTLYCSGVGLN